MKRNLWITVFFLLLLSGIQAQNLNNGLVAHFPFNGNGNDASGNNNNGTFSGSATIASPDQNNMPFSALRIFGPNNAGMFSVTNNATLQFSTGATFACWFKLNSNVGTSGTGNIVAGGSHCIFTKDGDAGGGMYFMTALSGTNLNFNVGNVSMTSLSYTYPNYTVGTWIHIAYVMDVSDHRLYINGNLVATVASPSNFNTMNNRNLRLGRYGSNWYPMDASMDEMRVYNRVLTPAEILILANNTAASIVINSVSAATFCAGGNIVVNFTTTGAVSVGNTYQLQLSDPAGGWANPVLVGTLVSNALTGTFNLNLPKAVPTGTGYTLRVVATAPTAISPASTAISINGVIGDVPNPAQFKFIGEQNDRAYFLSTITQTWTASQTTCQANGGNLAATPDANANTLLAMNTPAAGSHIGYTDAASEGNFIWVNGTPTGFTSWNSGEPNNSGNEDYTMIYTNGRWNDITNGNIVTFFLQLTTASSNSPVCTGGTITLFAPTVAGSTYLWSGPNGFTSSQQNPVLPNVTTAANGNYTVSITKGGCTIDYTLAVTVNPSPDAMSLNSVLPVSLANGLVLHYPMNGNANDASGNNLNGTMFGGITTVADRFGNAGSALLFNGTNAYIDAPDNTYFTGGDFTVSSWVKVNSYAGWSRVFDFGNGSANNNVLLGITNGTTGRPAAEIYNGTVTGGQVASASTQTGLNRWVLLTYTFENGTGKIFVNGTQVASATQTAPQNVLRTFCYIGRSNWSGDAYANASFDDFRIYNRTLSTLEITSLLMEQPDAMNLVAIPAAICPNTASAIKVIGSQIGVSYQLQNAATSTNIGAAQTGTGDTLSFATGNLAANMNFQVVATGPFGCSVIISAVTVNVITPAGSPTTTGASRCEPGSVVLSAAGAPVGAVYYWYTASTGGTQIYIGPNFTTPLLNSTTTYYVSIYANGCESNRTPVTATINLATSPAVNLYSGLIAHYMFDGNTADSSGRGNNATLYWNGGYTNDRFNQPNMAIQPVPGAYIGCGNAGDFQALTTQVTLSLWIYETNPNWGFQSPLMNKWQGNGLYMGLDNYYDIGQQQQMNRVRWRIDANTYVNSSSNVPYNTWHHIVCTYNGAQLRIYQNGQLTGTVNYTGVITNTIVSMEIGRQANGLGNTIFEGIYDDARVYNRALNPDEVMALYFNESVAFSNTPLCEGSTLQLSSPTIAGATYTWSGPNGFNSSQEDPAAITNVTAANAGTYSLVIVNPNGCTSSPQLNTVIVNPLPAAAATINDTVCASGNAILTASGGNSYLWYTNPVGGTAISGQTGATYTINNLTATDTFYVEAVSAAGCISPIRTAVIAVYQNPIQANLAVAGSTVCASSSTTTVTVQNSQVGVIYQAFYNSNPVSGTVNGNGGTITLTVNTTTLSTGSNTITILASQGSCGSLNLTNTATVIKNPVPSANISNSGPLNFCTGGNVTLSAPSGLNYSWSEGSTSQSILVTQSGSYSVTVTDANGCSNTSSVVNVNVVAPPVAGITAAGSTSFCQGGSVTLNASGGGTYAWSDGATSASINVTQSGNYYVVVSNGSCSDTSSVISVTVNPAPIANVSASGPLSFCSGDSVVLTSSANSGNLWSNGSTSNSITVNQSGNYSVTVTDVNGCSAVSALTNVNVLAPPVATITISGSTTICQGDLVQLDANGGSSYLWSNGSTSNSILTGQAGTYYVIASNGVCEDTSALVTVIVNPLPAVNFSMGNDTFFCINSPVFTLPAGSPAGGTYSGPGVSGSTFNPAISGTGYISIDYNYTDANGCSATASSTVYVDVCTGINTTNSNRNLSAIPNPANTNTLISWPENSAIELLEVFDATGRVVISENVSGRNKMEISVANLATGIYQVKLSGNETLFLKLVKN